MSETQTLSISMRPERLEDVVGHDSVVAAIRKRLAEGRIANGWLLSGPPGTGKTTLAKIIARAINDNAPAEITEVNAADENGIDAVRALVSTAGYNPMFGRRKVYILDEAQQLTAQAQNVLLTILEKEDNTAVFIFPTTDPGKLIDALKSRCLHFVLKPFTVEEMDALIQRAAARLGVPHNPEFAAAAIKAGISGPREAVMAFEKLADGVPLKDALYRPEHAPEYAAVAKAVLSGKWTQTAALLAAIPRPDMGGFRSVLAAFFRQRLLKSEGGPAAQAVEQALLAMGAFDAHELGVSYAVMTAILHRLARNLGAA